jgi:exonuclease III
MRIVSWNVADLGRWLAARDDFAAHVRALGDPDVLCLQETRIRSCRRASVVLAGDWNVSRSAADVTPRLRTEEPHATARAQLDERFAADGWVDIFRALHPAARQYGRPRSSTIAGCARTATMLRCAWSFGCYFACAGDS